MGDLIAMLEEVSGYAFTNEEIGLQALTHSSYAKANHMSGSDNERLEFLGDAVLEFVASQYLYATFPNMREGEMTRSRSWLVREDSLYKAALKIGLDKLIRLDPAEEKVGGRGKPSILSDAFEALIAAVFIDGGFEAADRFIHNSLLKDMNEEDLLPKKDPKTLLQEFIQAKKKPATISYELLEAAGPDHKKQFKMTVLIGDIPYGEGIGFSKREAEENAAKAALEIFAKQQEKR